MNRERLGRRDFRVLDQPNGVHAETHIFKGLVVLLLSLNLIVAPLPAQNSDTPVLRTTTRLVQLNVVALDKQNHTVKGLSQQEFQVFDNGVLQQIVHFAASADAVPSGADRRSPLVVSNRQGTRDQSAGVTVILVDELIFDAKITLSATGPEDPTVPMRAARLAVLQFLSTLKPGEQVALYALRREGVVVIHDFTDDQGSLIAAAKLLGGGGPRGKALNFDSLRSGGAPTLPNWSQNPAPQPIGNQIFRASDDTDKVLRGYGFQAIVDHLRGVPGRKNLVWISSTLPMSVTGLDIAKMAGASAANQPIDLSNLGNVGKLATEIYPDPQNHFNELQTFTRWLSNANISVYPIDANALEATTGLVGGPVSLAGPPAAQMAAADLIASETGGRAVFQSNALDQHLREVVEESNASYQIGYYPGDAAWNRKYHRIEVKLMPAHNGVSLHYRKGYYATDEKLPANADTALREVARSVVEAPGIGVALNVPSNPLEEGPEQVVLKLDIKGVQFEQSEERSKANLDVVFVQLGKDGRVLDGFKDHLTLALRPETYDAAETQGWFYPRDVWILQGAEKLRVVVRDSATGAVGSVSVPVRISNKRPS